MSTPKPEAKPLAIQLLSYIYDFNYELSNDSEITYDTEVLHRILPDSGNMDILVSIIYRARDQEEPVLQATCVTTYQMLNFPRKENPEGVEPHYVMPGPLGHQMTVEAIAHARAILAQQTGATPFHSSHIPLMSLQLAPGVETAQRQV